MFEKFKAGQIVKINKKYPALLLEEIEDRGEICLPRQQFIYYSFELSSIRSMILYDERDEIIYDV